METSVDVVLQVYDIDVLHCCLERIQTLFNVRSEIVEDFPSSAAVGCAQETVAQGFPSLRPHGSAHNVRLKLWTDTSNPGALKASKGVTSRHPGFPQAAKLGSVALTASEEADPYLVAEQVISIPELDRGVSLPRRRGRQRVRLVSTTQWTGDRLSVSSFSRTTRSSWWISEFVWPEDLRGINVTIGTWHGLKAS
ncbi:hypothetical protein HPB47_011914 [Ixodes persulcatus]|uniref:Uncharacterized protein n=1 Tax=Ixodes persulcatus TaxID=34615 RepID=A0AC60NV64_IXOPE|nr:hypothetical protein HPB47_011914 [Ixodes persulcatus]